MKHYPRASELTGGFTGEQLEEEAREAYEQARREADPDDDDPEPDDPGLDEADLVACKQCGTSFPAETDEQVYCSWACEDDRIQQLHDAYWERRLDERRGR